jgi:hypothetical protein
MLLSFHEIGYGAITSNMVSFYQPEHENNFSLGVVRDKCKVMDDSS